MNCPAQSRLSPGQEENNLIRVGPASDYLQFKKLDPMYVLNFPDKTLLARSHPAAMKAEIEKHFPGEGAGLGRFLERESLRFEKPYPCLQKPYGTLACMVSPALRLRSFRLTMATTCRFLGSLKKAPAFSFSYRTPIMPCRKAMVAASVRSAT